MFVSLIRSVFLAVLLLFSQTAKPEEKPIKFAELPVDGGKTYRDCTVIESDAEGFLIRHAGGMARISFFDVAPEIREQFDFDPVEALRFYEIRQETERMRRKQLLLESEKAKAEIARNAARKELEEVARKEWPPVLAQIVHRSETGLFVRAQRIEFVPTKVKSTLGFERDGPPKRILKPFSTTLIFLQGAKASDAEGSEWQGYVEPLSLKTIAHPNIPNKSVPVHLAVPPQ